MARSLPPIAALCKEHFAYARRVAARFGVPAGDVEDFAQEVLLQAVRGTSRVEDARALIFGITRHLAKRWLARRARSQAAEGEGIAEQFGPSADEQLVLEERRALVHAALSDLPEIFRDIFIAVELEGFLVSEAAQALGLGSNTAHTRLRLARARFQEALARHMARRGGQI